MKHRFCLFLFLCLTILTEANPLKAPEAGSKRAHHKKHVLPGHPGVEFGSYDFWLHLAVSVCLVLAGGVFAGLTLGLMGLDELHLRVLATSAEDGGQRRDAQTVLRLMKKGKHWVLVVLLLGNVIVNESLPVFLDTAVGGGYPAIIISTIAIVIFGEIIPQAFSVHYGLSIGARCSRFVLALMYILAPIAWPIARILDTILGRNEQQTYKKAELKSFLKLHRTGDEPLRDEELAILNSVLELNTKKVESIMTALKDTLTIAADAVLDYEAVRGIMRSGYSRIPVHEKDKPNVFVGMLLVKTLLAYDPKLALPVEAFPLTILPEASPSIDCFQALDYFQSGRAHLILISRTPGTPGGAIGIITLEDIIEEIISDEIIDETDQYHDNHSKKRVRRPSSVRSKNGIVEIIPGRRQQSQSPTTETTSLLDQIRVPVTAEPRLHYGSV